MPSTKRTRSQASAKAAGGGAGGGAGAGSTTTSTKATKTTTKIPKKENGGQEERSQVFTCIGRLSDDMPTSPAGTPLEWSFDFDSHVSQLAAGDYHAVMLLASGAVVAAGDNSNGALGVGDKGKKAQLINNAVLKPVPMALPASLARSRVLSVCAGAAHSVLVVQSGSSSTDVLACGSNNHGQVSPTLPVSKQSVVRQLTPVAALSGKGVTTISCGSFHNIAITEDDKVWVWGKNGGGGLGLGKCSLWEPPQVLEEACGKGMRAFGGENFTVWLQSKGGGGDLVHACGCNYWGQCAQGRDRPVHYSTLKPINALCGQAISAVACGRRFAVVYSASKAKVWAWGTNEQYAMGSGVRKAILPKPTLIKALCGRRLLALAAGPTRILATELCDGDSDVTGDRSVNVLSVGSVRFCAEALGVADDKGSAPKMTRGRAFQYEPQVVYSTAGTQHAAVLPHNGRLGQTASILLAPQPTAKASPQKRSRRRK